MALIHIHDNIKADTLAHRQQVQRFLQGDLSPEAFKPYLAAMGMYEQRQGGQYMVRIRLGAGLVTPEQLEHVAYLSETYGNGVVHLTTRQDIQLHGLDMAHTPDILESLLEQGLSTRGGGGNTVRNVAVGPYAGVEPEELFDVTPHAIALNEYLLQQDSAFTLPRKLKIALSGTAKDTSFASVTDLGYFAQIKDGQRGFAVYAAGGLGSKPRVGIEIDPFISEDQIFVVAEAIKRLFETHGDRENRRKARLRYVLERLGNAGFIQAYQEHKQAVINQGLTGLVPKLRPILPSPEPLDVSQDTPDALICVPQKTAGYYTVRLPIPQGDVPAGDLKAIAKFSRDAHVTFLRVTQAQDLLLLSVAQPELNAVAEAVSRLSIPLAIHLPTLVSCTGASTCKLGLCQSRGLAKAVAEALNGLDGNPETLPGLRISGCPNGCAQHLLSDIGFQGRFKRVGERRMPFYDVYANAQLEQGQSRLAECVGTLPAKRVPDFVRAVYEESAFSTEALKVCVARFSELDEANIPDAYFDDFE